MPKSHAPYPAAFRSEAVQLIRSGQRNPEQLAHDLGCSAQAIRNWVRQADLDGGRRHDGLTTAEREELARLRRENRVLREEREILRKAAAFFAKETTR
jgi:transposase